jgi:hypothetical protein
MTDTEPQPLPAVSSNAGRWTVVGMLAFGVAMVLAMWLYWELYTRTFRPLQVAIARAFPGSSPRVIGGRHKSHKQDSPRTLRIIVQIPTTEFDPEQDVERCEARAVELARLTEQHHDLANYEQLEIQLTQPIPEHEARHWSVSRPVGEWQAMLSRQPEKGN